MRQTTQRQKDLALKEFNLREKSKCWDSKRGLLSFKSVAAVAGVSDFTIGDWYACWILDPNTKLDKPLSVPSDKVDEYKDKYFEKLANGVQLSDLEVVLEYGVPRKMIKKWKQEFKKMGGTINYKKEHKATYRSIKPIEKNEVKNSSEPVEKLNDVDAVDKFFDGLITMKNEFKKSQDDLKKSQDEVKFYKDKCQKWATQVVELQNVIARRQ